ncbi:MAG: hypothetical protein GC134_07345 [Proteobacteria bacterium]|nr:hypothetical protein [Pseudomonadota bacterium]
MPLTSAKDGVTLRVKLTPSARIEDVSNCLQTPDGPALKASVRAVPEDGKANAALCLMLAKKLGIPKSAVAVSSGQTNRIKIISIQGLSAEDVKAKLGF